MLEPVYKISEDELRVRLQRIFEVIEIANSLIRSAEKTNDQFGVKQYLHLKSKFVKELTDLLASNFSIHVQLKNVA